MQDGEYNGSYVLVFNVPRAPRSRIPVYLHNNPDNTYKRNHEGDYRCDASEVRRMFADADIEDNPRDYKILPEFTIERDIDKVTLEQYRRMVATKRPDHPWLLLDDKNLLIKLKGYREDRRENIEGLTLAGLLMFGASLEMALVHVADAQVFFVDTLRFGVVKIDSPDKNRHIT